MASVFSNNLWMTVYRYWIWHNSKPLKHRYRQCYPLRDCFLEIHPHRMSISLKSCSNCMGSALLSAFWFKTLWAVFFSVTPLTLELLTNFPVTGFQTLHYPVWSTYPVFLHYLDDLSATIEEPLAKSVCNIALCWWLQCLQSTGCSYSAEQHLNKMSHIQCLVNFWHLRFFLGFFMEAAMTLAKSSSLMLITGTL